jgi:thiamine kinase-like enzyme
MISKKKLFGKNNNLSIINFNNRLAIKKKYAKNFITRFSRFHTEFFFINTLRRNKILNIPNILFYDKKNSSLIFEIIKGQKIKRVSRNDIKECLKFLKKINSKKVKKHFINFQNASDACLSQDEHINCVEKRILNLLKIKSQSNSSLKIKKFLKKILFKKFLELKYKIETKYSKKILKKKLSKNEIIVSPSDFGFHNIIKDNKKLFFIDFEYGGLDDPIKLLSDFLCNPDYKITKADQEYFKKKYFNLFYYKNIEEKFNLLFNFHKLKWCTMLLNDLISKKYQKRRFFAGYERNNLDLERKFKIAKIYYFNFFSK